MKLLITKEQYDNLKYYLIESEEEEYYRISPDEYRKWIKKTNYDASIFETMRFKNLPLYITGDLNLFQLPIDSLGNVGYIDGDLNISGTKIRSLGDTEVWGDVNDSNTPMEQIRIKKEELEKLAKSERKRDNKEWDLDNPNINEEGLAANALFDYLVSKGRLTEMDKDTKNDLQEKKDRLEEMNEVYNSMEESTDKEELGEEILNLESEIEEIQLEYSDVYYILMNRKPIKNLDIFEFEVVGLRGNEYRVGRYDQMEKYAVIMEMELLKDLGSEGLSQNLINKGIDKTKFEKYVTKMHREWISNDIDSYFDKDDFTLTDEQEERKEQLENYIYELEDLKTELEEKLENIEDSYSEEYKLIENQIEQIETNIEKSQEELDEIEPDIEPTEEMIEDKVQSYVEDAMDDIPTFIKDFGLDIKNFIDYEKIAKYIVDTDGLGVLNNYDGTYNEVNVVTESGKSHKFVIIPYEH